MPADLTNGNPLFYRSVVREQDGDRTVIYSMLDRLFVGHGTHQEDWVENIPETRNLTIHALDLTLLGEVRIPGGDIRIHCKKLIVEASDDGTPGAILDVTPVLPAGYQHTFVPKGADAGIGADGDVIAPALRQRQGEKYGAPPLPGPTADDPVPPNPYERFGTTGPTGGRITIVCDEIVLQGRLLLNALGGRGYPGCDGQQGGPADDLVRGIGSRGGRAGKGGDGGRGGAIALRYRTVDNQERIETDMTGGLPGTPGAPGEPGAPRGERGTAVALGESGADGEFDEDDGVDLQELGQVCDDVFLLRLVQKCKQLYLFNQPTKFSGSMNYPPEWEALGKLLDWTTNVLAGYAKEAAKDASLEYRRKNGLYKTTHNLLLRYRSGLTYDNAAPDWVPATPITTMFEEFERAFEGRRALEAHFLKLSRELLKHEEAQTHLNDARDSIAGAKMLHQIRYDALYKQLTLHLPGDIAAARVAVAAARGRLERELSAFEGVVSQHFHTCSLSDLLKAAETLAFTAGEAEVMAGMGVVQAASLINDGLNSLPNNRGEMIKKSVVLDEIVAVTGDLQETARGELFRLNENGKSEFIGENKKLLVTEIGKLRDEIKSFSKELSDATTNPPVQAIDEFQAALYEQGQALLLYHVLTAHMLEEYRAIGQADERAKVLNEKPDPLSHGWVSTVSYVAQLYQDELEATIAAVANLQRKAAYVTLDAQPELNLIRDLGKLWIDGTPPAGMDDLQRTVSNLHGEIVNHASSRGSASNLVPAQGYRSDLYVDIDGALLEEFKQRRQNKDGKDYYELTVTLVPGISKNPHELPVSNSSKYCDIRVIGVQPRIIGATSRTNRVAVVVSVGARTKFLDDQIEPVEHTFYMGGAQASSRTTSVVHDTNVTLERTPLKPDPPQPDSPGGELIDRYLDAPGLFGKWKIRCPPAVTDKDDNVGLDVSGVTAIRIYFRAYVQNHTLRARPSRVRAALIAEARSTT